MSTTVDADVEIAGETFYTVSEYTNMRKRVTNHSKYGGDTNGAEKTRSKTDRLQGCLN